jgi:uncharacterized protein (TIGR02285 family)
MRSGQQVVSLTLLKTPERETFIEYSALTSVKPTNGICIRSDEPHYKNSTEISLSELLDEGGLKIGIMHGRAYGRGADDILKRNLNNKNIYVRSASDGVNGLIKLLMVGRIDAAICYPHESGWVANQFGLTNKVKQLRLVELEPINFSYSGAPKTDWGRKIIRKINRIYKKHRIVQKTSVALEPYLDTDTAMWFRKEAQKLYGD